MPEIRTLRRTSEGCEATEKTAPPNRAILRGVSSRVSRIDHVQIAAPEGCEAAAREFYGFLLEDGRD